MAGTDNPLAAAREAGVSKFIAQSFAPFRYARADGPVKGRGRPSDRRSRLPRLPRLPRRRPRQMFAAMAHVDHAATAAGGIALRYGGFLRRAGRHGAGGAQAPVPPHRGRRQHHDPEDWLCRRFCGGGHPVEVATRQRSGGDPTAFSRTFPVGRRAGAKSGAFRLARVGIQRGGLAPVRVPGLFAASQGQALPTPEDTHAPTPILIHGSGRARPSNLIWGQLAGPQHEDFSPDGEFSPCPAEKSSPKNKSSRS